MKAVIIGAGKIGRGFIGHVLHEEGLELTFIDISRNLIDLLNSCGKYPVYILGGSQREYWVSNIKGYTPEMPGAVEALAEADLVTTAVGPSVLPQISGLISAGIRQRYSQQCTIPLNIIACENMEYGTTTLYKAVEKALTEAEREYCSKYVGFPDAEVSRISIPMDEQENYHPLAVKVEQYMEWIVDRYGLKGDISAINSIEMTNTPTAYIKRKIYTLTGHAMLGYLGYQKGYKYIYEAAYDSEIFHSVYRALRECARGWSREYDMDEEEFNLYSTIMLRRFSDTRLKDSVERVCLQPIRKLSRYDRLIGPAITALKHGVTPLYIIEGIVSALLYNSPCDDQAAELQRMLNENGIAYVLENVCGLTEQDDLARLVAERYTGERNA